MKGPSKRTITVPRGVPSSRDTSRVKTCRKRQSSAAVAPPCSGGEAGTAAPAPGASSGGPHGAATYAARGNVLLSHFQNMPASAVASWCLLSPSQPPSDDLAMPWGIMASDLGCGDGVRGAIVHPVLHLQHAALLAVPAPRLACIIPRGDQNEAGKLRSTAADITHTAASSHHTNQHALGDAVGREWMTRTLARVMLARGCRRAGSSPASDSRSVSAAKPPCPVHTQSLNENARDTPNSISARHVADTSIRAEELGC